MSPKFKAIKKALKSSVASRVKKIIIEKAAGQATERLFSALPFMAWGPLGYLASFMVTKGVLFLMDRTLLGGHILYIYGDATIDRNAAQRVIKKINEQSSEGISEERKKQLDDELAEDLDDLMRLSTI